MNRFEKVSFAQYVTSRRVDSGRLGDDSVARQEYEAIKLPVRATRHSAGYDFFAPFDFFLSPGESIVIPTGIRILLDDDKFLALYPRSGLGFKYRMQLNNTVGIIDADYTGSDNEGHILLKIYNGSSNYTLLSVQQGQAIAQGIIQQYFTPADDVVTDMRNGGFGSTDR